MDFGIKGRAAAVAASSQGLGFACALELAREGAAVAICSRDRHRVDDAARRIQDAVEGATVHAVVVDLSQRTPTAGASWTKPRKRSGASTFWSPIPAVPTPGALDQVSLDDVASRRRHHSHERDRTHDGGGPASAQESGGAASSIFSPSR